MFGLGTFAAGDERFAGLVMGDRVSDLRPHFGEHVSTGTLLAGWDTALGRLRDIAASSDPAAGVPLASVRPLPPVAPAGQLLCAGANYYRHTVEMTFMVLRDNPDEQRGEAELWDEAAATASRVAQSGQPFFFAGLPSALSGANDDVVLWGPGVEHDWELEIAVVIGRRGHRITPDQAMDHIAGYTICNDISTRDVMFRPRFALSDFVMSKNRPTFFPLGPYIVPREFVPDYRGLRIRLSVNRELMQDSTPQDMIYGLEDLVACASGVTELLPGDVVLTGSPAGNAAIHGRRWLKPGDVIDGEITGLGRQRNMCLPDPGWASRPGTGPGPRGAAS